VCAIHSQHDMLTYYAVCLQPSPALQQQQHACWCTSSVVTVLVRAELWVPDFMLQHTSTVVTTDFLLQLVAKLHTEMQTVLASDRGCMQIQRH
jgi:hypothetical protein